MKRIACLFPGIGYTCDKPLLYYSWRLLKGMGWEIVPVQYSGFPSGVKGNPEKMRQTAHMALKQADKQLRDIDWAEYSEVLFIIYRPAPGEDYPHAQRPLRMRRGTEGRCAAWMI